MRAHLRVLGLAVDDVHSPEAIHRAYGAAALRCHPDKGGTREAFEAVQAAYEALRNARGGGGGDMHLPSHNYHKRPRGDDATVAEMRAEGFSFATLNAADGGSEGAMRLAACSFDAAAGAVSISMSKVHPHGTAVRPRAAYAFRMTLKYASIAAAVEIAPVPVLTPPPAPLLDASKAGKVVTKVVDELRPPGSAWSKVRAKYTWMKRESAWRLETVELIGRVGQLHAEVARFRDHLAASSAPRRAVIRAADVRAAEEAAVAKKTLAVGLAAIAGRASYVESAEAFSRAYLVAKAERVGAEAAAMSAAAAADRLALLLRDVDAADAADAADDAVDAVAPPDPSEDAAIASADAWIAMKMNAARREYDIHFRFSAPFMVDGLPDDERMPPLADLDFRNVTVENERGPWMR